MLTDESTDNMVATLDDRPESGLMIDTDDRAPPLSSSRDKDDQKYVYQSESKSPSHENGKFILT